MYDICGLSKDSKGRNGSDLKLPEINYQYSMYAQGAMTRSLSSRSFKQTVQQKSARKIKQSPPMKLFNDSIKRGGSIIQVESDEDTGQINPIVSNTTNTEVTIDNNPNIILYTKHHHHHQHQGLGISHTNHPSPTNYKKHQQSGQLALQPHAQNTYIQQNNILM